MSEPRIPAIGTPPEDFNWYQYHAEMLALIVELQSRIETLEAEVDALTP